MSVQAAAAVVKTTANTATTTTATAAANTAKNQEPTDGIAAGNAAIDNAQNQPSLMDINKNHNSTSIVAVLVPKDRVSIKQFRQITQVCETVFDAVDYYSPNGTTSLNGIKTLSEFDFQNIIKYKGLVVPDGLGWYDQDTTMESKILEAFIKAKLPVCMIGTGLAIIKDTINNGPWILNSYSIAAPNIHDDYVEKVDTCISEIIVNFGGNLCSSLKGGIFFMVGNF